jgi:hypothetical protein
VEEQIGPGVEIVDTLKPGAAGRNLPCAPVLDVWGIRYYTKGVQGSEWMQWLTEWPRIILRGRQNATEGIRGVVGRFATRMRGLAIQDD